MKYKFNYILLSLMLTTTSCLDMLNEDPSHLGTAETFFTTEKGINSAINACYSSLRDIHNDRTIWLHGTDQFQRSGYFPQKTTVFNTFNDYSPAALNSESSVINNFWKKLWDGINRCNVAIKYCSESSLSNKEIRIGEVKTLRALYYYYLVEQFGDIPFPLKPYDELQTTAERISESVIYEQLIKDLKDLVDNDILPSKADNYGRITKGAAQFLLSKLYLTRGYKPYKKSDDFKNAAKVADDLISSGDYKLLPEYYKIFVPGNEKNEEIIFSIQYSDDITINGSGNNYHSKFGFFYDQVPGPIRSNYYNRSQRVFCETFYVADCFGVDDNGKNYEVPNGTLGLETPSSNYSFKKDKRYDATFRRLYMTEKTNIDFVKNYGLEMEKKWTLYAGTDSKNGEVIPLVYTGVEEHINKNYWEGTGRDTCIYIPAPDEIEWTDEKCKSVPYAVIPHRYWNQNLIWKRGVCMPTIAKFWEPTSGYNDALGVRDLFLFRLGEVYLLSAEAHYQSGNIPEAVNKINVIRRRANGKGINEISEMDIKDSDVNIDFILDERTRELAGEELRWVELKRTGKLIERVKKYNVFAGSEFIPNGPHIKEYHLLRPLPNEWLSVLENKVNQNPGY